MKFVLGVIVGLAIGYGATTWYQQSKYSNGASRYDSLNVPLNGTSGSLNSTAGGKK